MPYRLDFVSSARREFRKSSPKRVVSLRRTRGRTGPWDQAAAVMSVGRVAVPGLAKAA